VATRAAAESTCARGGSRYLPNGPLSMTDDEWLSQLVASDYMEMLGCTQAEFEKMRPWRQRQLIALQKGKAHSRIESSQGLTSGFLGANDLGRQAMVPPPPRDVSARSPAFPT